MEAETALVAEHWGCEKTDCEPEQGGEMISWGSRKCWSHLKASLASGSFACVLKWCLENNLLIIFPAPFPHTPFLSLRVTTVKYQSMPVLASPALMEEPATFSPDSRSISGTAKFINICLTVLRYTSKLFLYWTEEKKKIFEKVNILQPPTTFKRSNPRWSKKIKTSLCLSDLSLRFAALNIENQIRVDTLSHSSFEFRMCESLVCVLSEVTAH